MNCGHLRADGGDRKAVRLEHQQAYDEVTEQVERRLEPERVRRLTTTDAHALTGAHAVHALHDEERAAFERHLTGCEACAQGSRSSRPPPGVRPWLWLWP
ncbi:zf-HC2 domain-containing protein [Streptomyces populi]|uniref:zf-HC2 domain-containing protein n=1 Tax=Streptomyces populi TaxID=2058924 RepID=UPI0035D7C199